MVEHTTVKDIAQLREIWRLCFPNEDIRYTDYFFKKIFKPEYGLAYKENQTAVSCLCKIPHDIMLNGIILRASMIVGVATLPKYRNRGYMHKMMDICLDGASHSELVTLIQAYNPSLYEQFGFQIVYYHQFYELTRDNIERITNEGCAFNPSVNDMFKVYSLFVKRFNGFYIRDYDYFNNYIEEIKSQGGKIVAYYDEYGLIQGYATLLLDKQTIKIEECIYLNSVALYKLLNVALQQRHTAYLHVSANEDLSILLKGAKASRYGFTMARINDYELFNRLYGSKVNNVIDAFKLGNKPLYMNEFA